MVIRQARLEPLALSVSGHERMVNGWAAVSGEEKFDSPEAIARFSDILNKERPIVEIGPRSIFVNSVSLDGSSQQGRVCARSDPAGVAREAWSERTVASGMRTVASGQ